jgi:hypothetical protein
MLLAFSGFARDLPGAWCNLLPCLFAILLLLKSESCIRAPGKSRANPEKASNMVEPPRLSVDPVASRLFLLLLPCLFAILLLLKSESCIRDRWYEEG